MNKRYIITGIILIAVIAGAVFFFKKNGGVPNLAPVGAKAKGPVNAPVQIIVFSDFQCPSCKVGHETVEKLMTEFPDKIHVQFAHFPLRMHRFAAVAHRAAECAHQQGQFWPYHDRLYKEQETWSLALDPTLLFYQYASDLKLNDKRFRDCIVAEKTDMTIFTEKEEGRNALVERTPTYMVNGQRFVGSIELESKVKELLGVKDAAVTVPPTEAAPPAPETVSAAPEMPAPPATS